MLFFSRSSAVIWPSAHAVYVMKRRRDWLGRDLYYQCCVYTELPGKQWLNQPEQIEKVMRKLIFHYNLEGYTIKLVLGGSQLIWKKLSLPSKKKEDALQMAMWDEMEGLDSQEYVIDIHAVTKQHKDATYDWMMAAYRNDAVQAFHRGIENSGGVMMAIDVLPALIGRFYQKNTGTFYVREEKKIHTIFIHNGIPLSYVLLEDLPAEAVRWTRANDVDTGNPLCLSERMGTPTWSVPPLPRRFESIRKKWDLPYPIAFLAAM